MITPPSLQKGDTIAIVAPARKIEKYIVDKAAKIISAWGYNVRYGKHLFSEHHQYAGTDRERIADFQEAVNDTNVKAVFCVRGGYGTLRIIDNIDFSPLEKNPKWICGYSDITVIHQHLLSQHHIASLHCTMPVNFSENSEESLLSLKDCLEGSKPFYSVTRQPLNQTGTAEGILAGGNLSLLYALSGSASLPDMEGKILFIEDLDEYLYHTDRMMIQLLRSGVLKKIKGLIVGGFTNMKDNTVPFGKTAEEIISEHVSGFSYPVCFGFPAGHISDNLTLIIGNKVKLNVQPNTSTLTFL